MINIDGNSATNSYLDANYFDVDDVNGNNGVDGVNDNNNVNDGVTNTNKYNNTGKNNFSTSNKQNNNLKLPNRYYDPEHKGWTIAWVFLHAIADSFPENPSAEDKKYFNLMFEQCLPRLLPCSDCGGHMGEDISKHEPDASSGEKLSIWLYEFHNRVNKMTGKKPLSIDECRRDQEYLRAIKWSRVISDLKESCNGVNDRGNIFKKYVYNTSDSTSDSTSDNTSDSKSDNTSDNNKKCTFPDKDHTFRRNSFLSKDVAGREN